jgi:hypothetical protein
LVILINPITLKKAILSLLDFREVPVKNTDSNEETQGFIGAVIN